MRDFWGPAQGDSRGNVGNLGSREHSRASPTAPQAAQGRAGLSKGTVLCVACLWALPFHPAHTWVPFSLICLGDPDSPSPAPGMSLALGGLPSVTVCTLCGPPAPTPHCSLSVYF